MTKQTPPASELTYCDGCGINAPCKQTGEYQWDGKTYPIMTCQWCRAVETKRNRKLNEQHNNRAN